VDEIFASGSAGILACGSPASLPASNNKVPQISGARFGFSA